MASWDKYKPQKGLVFYSPYSAMQVPCRGRKLIYAQDGTVIDEIRELLVEFATFGNSMYIPSPLDETDTILMADVRGNYADIDMQAEAKDWDEEEWALVCKRMLWFADVGAPQEVKLWSAPKVSAPWPTYDTTHANKIGNLAETLGFIGEAILYEKQTKNRDSVVTDLEKRLLVSQEEAIVVEEDSDVAITL